MLFMGQEWACTSPFRFFTDHHEELGHLVTEGRRKEFRHFSAFADPEVRETIPDPQAASTFEACKLDWSEREREPHASALRLHQELLRLRRTEPALRTNSRLDYEAAALDDSTLMLVREAPGGDRLLLVVRLRGSGSVDLGGVGAAAAPDGRRWRRLLTTEDPAFAPDATAPEVALDGPAPVIRFPRPAAVILKAASEGPDAS
jgi:maltooligosyltrehalose trehalohydrolase